MSFRLRVAAWFVLSVILLAGTLFLSAHYHLDEELRKDRWDRSHPEFPGWIIHGSYTDEEVQDILGELLQVWLWVGIPVILLSAVVGWFIAMRSIRPIRKINLELAALDFRSIEQGVQLPDKDAELSNLVSHLNDLLARIRASYSEMEEFSARVAHELRTPLTILRMKTEAASSRLPEDFSEDFQEEITRLTRLVENLLLTAKAEGGKLEVQTEIVDLSGLLNDLREGYELLAAERDIHIEWHVATGLHGLSDAVLLRQILHNLLGNAVRHGSRQIKVTALQQKQRAIIHITNACDPGQPPTRGVSQGLRVVRSLIAAQAGHSLTLRKSPRFFSIRLGFSGE
jgi:signal transduction histidine kinase